jgi:hypothetical protein
MPSPDRKSSDERNRGGPDGESEAKKASPASPSRLGQPPTRRRFWTRSASSGRDLDRGPAARDVCRRRPPRSSARSAAGRQHAIRNSNPISHGSGSSVFESRPLPTDHVTKLACVACYESDTTTPCSRRESRCRRARRARSMTCSASYSRSRISARDSSQESVFASRYGMVNRASTGGPA